MLLLCLAVLAVPAVAAHHPSAMQGMFIQTLSQYWGTHPVLHIFFLSRNSYARFPVCALPLASLPVGS